jgi:hypothetical protein
MLRFAVVQATAVKDTGASRVQVVETYERLLIRQFTSSPASIRFENDRS